MTIGDLVAGGALWVTLPIAVAAGMVSFLSPCVLPLVPGYLGFIGAAVGTRKVASRRRLLGGVALFIAGFTVVFITVNIVGGALGRFFIQYQDAITRVLGVVVAALGLVFVGLFGVAQRSVKPQVRGTVGLIGAPLLGLALGVGWVPCIGPTLTAILAISWNLADPVRAGLLGLAYSLGLGIPFVLLALGLGWATRSVAVIRRHVRTVNLIGGGLLIVLGVLMISGVWTDLITRLAGVISGVPLPI